MGKRIGVICVVLGVVCILSAIGFLAYNRWEAARAKAVSQDLLGDVKSMIEERHTVQPLPDHAVNQPDHVVIPEVEKSAKEMSTIQVDGYDCIGILTIPALDLELPVLTDWSYAKLKKAPCHYYGSYYEKDFVIAAHNYKAHFGRLSSLQIGDIVCFTDVDGAAYLYEVAILETLPKEATKEMITGGFDLSLYTCTPGGANRVTVRCTLVTQ